MRIIASSSHLGRGSNDECTTSVVAWSELLCRAISRFVVIWMARRGSRYLPPRRNANHTPSYLVKPESARTYARRTSEDAAREHMGCVYMTRFSPLECYTRPTTPESRDARPSISRRLYSNAMSLTPCAGFVNENPQLDSRI